MESAHVAFGYEGGKYWEMPFWSDHWQYIAVLNTCKTMRSN